MKIPADGSMAAILGVAMVDVATGRWLSCA